MCRNYSSIKFKRGPLPIVLLYVLSMFLLMTGVACLVAAIDPRPLPKETWPKLVIAGVLSVANGLIFLLLLIKIKSLPTIFPPSTQMSNATVGSAADLLNETLFEDSVEYSIVNYGSSITLESVKTINQSMTQSTSSTGTVFYYKETMV